MKQYFVQTMTPDGDIIGGMHTAQEIINMAGFRDCSGNEIYVWDYTFSFDTMVRLIEESEPGDAPNYHRFYNPATNRTEFEGYSPEH